MRLILAAIIAFCTLDLVIACCGSKSTFSCCGKGKCNVFCCNCKGGCKPKDECNPYSGQICWVFGETIQCDSKRSIDPSLIPSTAISPPRSAPVLSRRELELAAIEEREIQLKDEEQLNEVDTEGKGGFTFEEFLKYKEVEASPEAATFFNMYDHNGDGIITLDEMRLAE